MAVADAGCEEKARFLRAYSFSVSDYNRAVMLLQERSGVMSREEYEKLRTFVENTRELVENCRMALEAHTADHGC
ncbi:MAG TPA: hypothetical protein VG273_07915 [Bryobacteraceae bacterium]|jgi:hypothetical protein|nr:hypothetical protein [Bryobacteraceae bacterium]